MHWFDPLLETIAKEFDIKDPEENLGAQMLRQASEKTGEAVKIEEHWRERRWGAVIVYILFGLLFLAGSIWLAHLRGWL